MGERTVRLLFKTVRTTSPTVRSLVRHPIVAFFHLQSLVYVFRADTGTDLRGFEHFESFYLEDLLLYFVYCFSDGTFEKKLHMKRSKQLLLQVPFKVCHQCHRITTRGVVNHQKYHRRGSASRPHLSCSSNVDTDGTSVSTLFNIFNEQYNRLCMRVSRSGANLTNDRDTVPVRNEER